MPHLNKNGVIDPATFQTVKNALHTNVVSEVVDSYGSNRVLNARPLVIHPTEAYLPRLMSAT